MAGKAEGLQATIDGMKRELSRLRGQEDLCASVVGAPTISCSGRNETGRNIVDAGNQVMAERRSVLLYFVTLFIRRLLVLDCIVNLRNASENTVSVACGGGRNGAP